MVTPAGETALPTVTAIGTAGPLGAPSGIFTLNWATPMTKVGAPPGIIYDGGAGADFGG